MSTAEPELAKKDFLEVLRLDPNNSAAARSVNACTELLKKQRSQEKKIYANMFEKFAKHDKEVSMNSAWAYSENSSLFDMQYDLDYPAETGKWVDQIAKFPNNPELKKCKSLLQVQNLSCIV